MAWGEKYRIEFTSMSGLPCVVSIYESGYTGLSTDLTPADNPFETKEDNDSDIYKPLRKNIATIKIVTDDMTLEDSIIPADNISTMVTLDINDDIHWRGFLQTSLYEQPLSPGYRVLTMKATSVTGCLRYLDPPVSWIYEKKSFWEILRYCYSTLGISPYTTLINTHTTPDDFLSHRIDSDLFFESTERDEEKYIVTRYIAKMNMEEIFEALCTLHGMVMRDTLGDSVSFIEITAESVYSTNSHYRTSVYNSSGTLVNTIEVTSPATTTFSNSLRGEDNTISRLASYRNIDISLNISDYIYSIVNPLKVKYNSTDTLYELYGTDTYIQFPTLTSYNQVEGNTFSAARHREADDEWGNVTLSEALSKSAALGGTQRATPYGWAFSLPCAFIKREGGGFASSWGSGIYINLSRQNDYVSPNTAPYLPAIYTLRSKESITVSEGFLMINFSYFAFVASGTSPQSTQALEDPDGNHLFNSLTYRLRIGGRFFDEGVWAYSSMESRLMTDEDGPSGVAGDYVQPWSVNPSQAGLIVNIPETLTGVLAFEILGRGAATRYEWQDGGGNVYCASQDDIGLVLHDFSIKYSKWQRITDIEQESNNYTSRNNTTSPSNDESLKSVELTIGTRRNNTPSPSFLIDSTGAENIEQLSYTTNSVASTERPESRLSEGMSEYYSKPRKMLSYETSAMEVTGTDNPIYTDGNKIYLRVSAKTKWRDDQRLVQLIEIADVKTYEPTT
jgi:hypothetical protein